MVIVLVCVVVSLGSLVVVLWAWSWPGRPRAFTDASGVALPNSLAEKVRLSVNGVTQGIVITSTDTRHPVLLFLHGGLPEFFLAEKVTPRLDELFTVAWWEQRGSGLSYDPHASREALTVNQLVADTLEVTRYLRTRFGHPRIYVMGHSGGTIIGVQAVAQAPEFFHAYIGVAQMARQLVSEQQAYRYMLDAYRRRGETKTLACLFPMSCSVADVAIDATAAQRTVSEGSLAVWPSVARATFPSVCSKRSDDDMGIFSSPADHVFRFGANPRAPMPLVFPWLEKSGSMRHVRKATSRRSWRAACGDAES